MSSVKEQVKMDFGAMIQTVVRLHVNRVRSYGGETASVNPLHKRIRQYPRTGTKRNGS